MNQACVRIFLKPISSITHEEFSHGKLYSLLASKLANISPENFLNHDNPPKRKPYSCIGLFHHLLSYYKQDWLWVLA
ncbi:unnamed protein product [Blepharisma stoltei]|uniref:Maturase K n=1 Tax=Blepharisma stoltei TaxID=1481888 RepID=A0AAU9IU70_9CILI|nr:unnamed protein product [Blepharisma stoltei]